MSVKVDRHDNNESKWINDYLKNKRANERSLVKTASDVSGAKCKKCDDVLTSVDSSDGVCNKCGAEIKNAQMSEGFLAIATTDLSKKLWNTENKDCMYMSAILDSIVENSPEKLAKLANSPTAVDRMKEYMDYMYSTMSVRHPSVAEALKYYGDKVGIVMSMAPIGKTAGPMWDTVKQVGTDVVDGVKDVFDPTRRGDICRSCNSQYGVNPSGLGSSEMKCQDCGEVTTRTASLEKFAIDPAAKTYFDQIFENTMGSYEFTASDGSGKVGDEYDSNINRKDTTLEYLESKRGLEQLWDTRSTHEKLKGQNGDPKEGYDVKLPGHVDVLTEGQETVDIIPTYTNSGKVRTNQEAQELRVSLTETMPVGIGSNWFGAVPHEKEELREIWDIAEEVGKDGVVELAAALKSTVRKIRAATHKAASVCGKCEVEYSARGICPQCRGSKEDEDNKRRNMGLEASAAHKVASVCAKCNNEDCLSCKARKIMASVGDEYDEDGNLLDIRHAASGFHESHEMEYNVVLDDGWEYDICARCQQVSHAQDTIPLILRAPCRPASAVGKVLEDLKERPFQGPLDEKETDRRDNGISVHDYYHKGKDASLKTAGPTFPGAIDGRPEGMKPGYESAISAIRSYGIDGVEEFKAFLSKLEPTLLGILKDADIKDYYNSVIAGQYETLFGQDDWYRDHTITRLLMHVWEGGQDRFLPDPMSDSQAIEEGLSIVDRDDMMTNGSIAVSLVSIGRFDLALRYRCANMELVNHRDWREFELVMEQLMEADQVSGSDVMAEPESYFEMWLKMGKDSDRFMNDIIERYDTMDSSIIDKHSPVLSDMVNLTVDVNRMKLAANHLYDSGNKEEARRIRVTVGKINVAREQYAYFLDKIAVMNPPSNKIARWNLFVSNLMIDSEDSFSNWQKSASSVEKWATGKFAQWNDTRQLAATLVAREYDRYLKLGEDRSAREVKKLAADHGIYMQRTAGVINVGFADMKKDAFDMGDAGGLALDALQFVPGLGEGIGVIRMINAARKGKWLEAAFYAITLVPIAGDVVGTGLKWLYKLGPKALKSKAVVSKAKPLIDKAIKAWPQVKNKIAALVKDKEKRAKVLGYLQKADADMGAFLSETKQSIEDVIKGEGIDGLKGKVTDFMSTKPATASLKTATEYIMDPSLDPNKEPEKEKPDPVRRWNDILKDRGMDAFKPKSMPRARKPKGDGTKMVHDFEGDLVPESDAAGIIYDSDKPEEKPSLNREWYDRDTFEATRVDEAGQARINTFFTNEASYILDILSQYSEVGALAELAEAIESGNVPIESIENAHHALSRELNSFSSHDGEENAETRKSDYTSLKGILDSIVSEYPDNERELVFESGDGVYHSFEVDDYAYWMEDDDVENSGWVMSNSPVDQPYITIKEEEGTGRTINFRDPDERRDSMNHRFSVGQVITFEKGGQVLSGEVDANSSANDKEVSVMVGRDLMNVLMADVITVAKKSGANTKVSKSAITRVILKDPATRKQASVSPARAMRLARLKEANPEMYKNVVTSPLLSEAHPEKVVGDGFYREDAAQEEDLKAANSVPTGKQGASSISELKKKAGHINQFMDSAKDLAKEVGGKAVDTARGIGDAVDHTGKNVGRFVDDALDALTPKKKKKKQKKASATIEHIPFEEIVKKLHYYGAGSKVWTEDIHEAFANYDQGEAEVLYQAREPFVRGSFTDGELAWAKALGAITLDEGYELGADKPEGFDKEFSLKKKRTLEKRRARLAKLNVAAEDDKKEDKKDEKKETEEEVKDQTKQVKDFYGKTAEYDELTGEVEEDEKEEDKKEEKLNPHDPSHQKKMEAQTPDIPTPNLFESTTTASLDLDDVNASLFKFNRDDYIEFTNDDRDVRGWVKKIGPSQLLVDVGGSELKVEKDAVRKVARGSSFSADRMQPVDPTTVEFQEGDEIGFRWLGKSELEYGTILQAFGEGVGETDLLVAPFSNEKDRMRISRLDVTKMWRYQ